MIPAGVHAAKPRVVVLGDLARGSPGEPVDVLARARSGRRRPARRGPAGRGDWTRMPSTPGSALRLSTRVSRAGLLIVTAAAGGRGSRCRSPRRSGPFSSHRRPRPGRRRRARARGRACGPSIAATSAFSSAIDVGRDPVAIDDLHLLETQVPRPRSRGHPNLLDRLERAEDDDAVTRVVLDLVGEQELGKVDIGDAFARRVEQLPVVRALGGEEALRRGQGALEEPRERRQRRCPAPGPTERPPAGAGADGGGEAGAAAAAAATAAGAGSAAPVLDVADEGLLQADLRPAAVQAGDLGLVALREDGEHGGAFLRRHVDAGRRERRRAVL